MKVAVVKESFPGERRVAIVPNMVPLLTKASWEVLLETGAGSAAGLTDDLFKAKGAQIIPDRATALGQADVLLQVRTLGANPEAGRADLQHLKPGQVVIGMSDPLGQLP
ncbi:MAG: NAD(P)(+) transhydrogenase (Re/Si-specific) subunit alpha, partial [Pirellulales bacterium]